MPTVSAVAAWDRGGVLGVVTASVEGAMPVLERVFDGDKMAGEEDDARLELWDLDGPALRTA